VLFSLLTCVLRVASAESRPAAATRFPFSRVAARSRCATPARPRRPQAGPTHSRCWRYVDSESIPTGSGPQWPRVLPAAGSRPGAAPRLQPGLGFLQPGFALTFSRGFRVAALRVPARCRYAASTCPGRGPLPLPDSGPTSATSGRARPVQRHSTSPAESARVPVRPQPAPSPRGLRHWH
jgi:hypothetical protein